MVAMGAIAASGAAVATRAFVAAGGAAPNAGATVNELKQSPHQAAPGTTIAAQPGQRAVDTSGAMVISIDIRQPQVDPASPVEVITVP
jgi:hypothetical protein